MQDAFDKARSLEIAHRNAAQYDLNSSHRPIQGQTIASMVAKEENYGVMEKKPHLLLKRRNIRFAGIKDIPDVFALLGM